MTFDGNTDCLVSLRRASKRYIAPGFTRDVLTDIDVNIRPGDRLAVVGPNGSGKTTLLRIMLGLEASDGGDVDIRTRNAAYIPQDYRASLFPWLTVRQNVELQNPNGTRSVDFWSNFDELASAFRIRYDLSKYPYQLSGGEQQILLVIRAVLAQPALLVLDEALSAVDFGRRRTIIEYLSAWLSRHAAAGVVASHDFEEAVLLADTVIVLRRDVGAIARRLKVDIDWPRSLECRETRRFKATVSQVIEAVG